MNAITKSKNNKTTEESYVNEYTTAPSVLYINVPEVKFNKFSFVLILFGFLFKIESKRI